jgi:dTMP kinase
MAQRGVFISFEGTEGSGKSTQLRLLVQRLRMEGYPVVENQEPGGTAIGKQIRRILLDPEYAEMAARTELLLMFASRAQAASEVICPALAKGAVVVSDRFTDSTLAYQGEGRGLGFELVRRAHEIAVGSLMPDLTICIDIDIKDGLARANRRNEDQTGNDESRIDQHGLAFHERVQAGYRKIAAEEPERFRMVDGGGSPSVVSERIWNVVLLSLESARARMRAAKQETESDS